MADKNVGQLVAPDKVLGIKKDKILDNLQADGAAADAWRDGTLDGKISAKAESKLSKELGDVLKTIPADQRAAYTRVFLEHNDLIAKIKQDGSIVSGTLNVDKDNAGPEKGFMVPKVHLNQNGPAK
ncbi:MAG: hypothetical protein K2X09_06585 [Rickettsiales bacterium]|nr:hypothetical protein [Rickettsiales bacterium]